MPFTEHIAPFLRATMEILREEGRPMQPDRVRKAVSERVPIASEYLALDGHGQARWWAQLGFRTGEAASIGWMSKRNGWSITPIGVQALENFPDVKLYRELARQYRTRRQPNQLKSEDAPAAFEQFQQNLGYARQLVHGGRNLERLGVGAFDVTDLYRAAWTQSVAALDHWITREIVDRAVSLALQPHATRPPKFIKLAIPVEMFEKVHYHNADLGQTFRTHLEQIFGFMTFQNPDKIKEGFAHISTVNLWVRVAEVLTEQDTTAPVTSDGVRGRLREIAWRRNNIAHTADHDPEKAGQKSAITAREAEETIDWLESIAIAIQLALGDPVPTRNYDAAPTEVGTLGAVPTTPNEKRSALIRGQSNWDEESLVHAIEQYCPPRVAGTLLAVYRHAERHPSFRGYYFGQAVYPSVTAWFGLGSDEAAVWSIYTGASKSVLSINFEWMNNRGTSSDRLSGLADSLSVLPGWRNIPAQLSSANYARRPSLLPIALEHPGASETILTALNELLAVVEDHARLP
ncbi:hypothetical protein GCM10022226_12040 [Sphaerisporangium flaviroseum]|uniref:DUF4145 domain-containing protein n=1 Tax=Sphaerisporangium flaviroseum TaxID=509199 RepID=A0ABP7HGS0_9ACTN